MIEASSAENAVCIRSCTRRSRSSRTVGTMPFSVFALGPAGGRGAALARSHQRSLRRCPARPHHRSDRRRRASCRRSGASPRFLRTTSRARVHPSCWSLEIASALLFVQDGWCVRFDPARPYAKDAAGAPHAWDMRADWRAADPACSAIMTRSYRRPRASFRSGSSTCRRRATAGPIAADRPPGATVAMQVRGFLNAREDGVLQIDAGPDVAVALQRRRHRTHRAGAARTPACTSSPSMPR